MIRAREKSTCTLTLTLSRKRAGEGIGYRERSWKRGRIGKDRQELGYFYELCMIELRAD